MAIKGSLKEASLPDVLQLLALGNKTGCLAVADRQNFGYVYFDEGRICYASIVNRRDRLGDLLKRSHVITAEQLEGAIRLQEQRREKRLGEILVEMGALTREDLQRFVQLQIEESVYFLFTWTSGTFNFEAGVRPEQQEFLVSINPESLLLEGARRVDEWSQIEKKIPSFDLIFQVDPERMPGRDVSLSPTQQKLLPLLDGTRDVQRLIDEAGGVEFELCQALFGLITAGYVRRVGTSAPAPEQPRANELRVQEHRNLGVAFFKTGMLDEAQREFRRVIELRSEDAGAPFYLGLIALKQARWLEAVEILQQAATGNPRPAVLHDLAFGLEQLGRLAEADQAYAEAAARGRDDPRILMGWGLLALKRNEPEAALSRLQRAAELWGTRPKPVTWYWAMALAYGCGGDLENALQVAREGVSAFPHQAVLGNNLAVLLELNGELADAELALRTALAEDPTLPQVSKNLGDLLYRAGRFEDASEAYERAAKLAPDLGEDLYFKLGNIAYKQRDRERARTCWQRVTELNPTHQLARANLDTLDTTA